MSDKKRVEHVNTSYPTPTGRQGVVEIPGNADNIRYLDPLRNNVGRRLNRLETEVLPAIKHKPDFGGKVGIT